MSGVLAETELDGRRLAVNDVGLGLSNERCLPSEPPSDKRTLKTNLLDPSELVEDRGKPSAAHAQDGRAAKMEDHGHTQLIGKQTGLPRPMVEEDPLYRSPRGRGWGGRISPARGGLMEAHEGDRIIIESAKVQQSARRGEIVEVISGATGQKHYRVRWEDGHETVFFPSSDARVEAGSNAG